MDTWNVISSNRGIISKGMAIQKAELRISKTDKKDISPTYSKGPENPKQDKHKENH